MSRHRGCLSVSVSTSMPEESIMHRVLSSNMLLSALFSTQTVSLCQEPNTAVYVTDHTSPSPIIAEICNTPVFGVLSLLAESFTSIFFEMHSFLCLRTSQTVFPYVFQALLVVWGVQKSFAFPSSVSYKICTRTCTLVCFFCPLTLVY